MSTLILFVVPMEENGAEEFV
jgi:hypothetical protein